MIDSQVRVNDVTDRRLISAMMAVPREVFVPAAKRASAYADIAGRNRVRAAGWRLRAISPSWSTSPPSARKTAFSISRRAPAIRAPSCRAWPLRSLRWKKTRPPRRLCATALPRQTCRASRSSTGPLKAGFPSKGPFDVIIVNGAVEDVPAAWLAQLAEGGRLAVAGGRRRRPPGPDLHRVGRQDGLADAVRHALSRRCPGFEKAAEFRF